VDKEFMEFWGNFFLAAAKGQQQFEDMVTWLRGNVSGTQEVTDLFTKLYGVDEFLKNTPEYLKFWNASLLDFQKSFREFLSLMDLVTKDDFTKILNEKEELEAQVHSLENTVEELQQLLKEKYSLDESVAGFQALMSEQTRQFQEMIKGLGEVFVEDQSPGEQEKSSSGAPKKNTPRTPTPRKKTSRVKKPRKG